MKSAARIVLTGRGTLQSKLLDMNKEGVTLWLTLQHLSCLRW